MVEPEVFLSNLLCYAPMVDHPVKTSFSGLGHDWVLGPCDLQLSGDQMSVRLNPEWLAKQTEAPEDSKKKGFFARSRQKYLDRNTSWLKEKFGSGLTIPFEQVGKITGKEFKAFGQDANKSGVPLDHEVRFAFNGGDHFWGKSFLEFRMTAVEYATTKGFLISCVGLSGRLDFQEDYSS